MTENYQDYVFKDNKPVYKFEEMYRNCEDPWNIKKSIDKSIDYELILAYIRNYKNKFQKEKIDILEIGCGKGHFSKKLINFGKVCGIDISPTAIEYAKNNNPDAEFYCIDIKSNNFKLLKKFDFVIFYRVIWYVIDYLNICLKNINSVLKPDAQMIFDINFYQGNYYGKNIISSKNDFVKILKKYFSIIESIDHYNEQTNFNDFSFIICSPQISNL